MDKLVSIIIPAYNVEKYITETLDSVVGQTYGNLEIIIVNDGSVDKTGEIVESYLKNDSRIILINQQNKGVSCARNSGLEKATGEYICIFDSDDIMSLNKIEIQTDFLEKNPNYDFVYSNTYHFIDSAKENLVLSVMKPVGNFYQNFLKYGNFINPNTVFFRKRLYEKYGGFDENLRSAEDWEYWLKLSYNNVSFGMIPDFLTYYRMRNNSLSSDTVVISKSSTYVLEKQQELHQSAENYKIINRQLYKWRLKTVLAYFCKKDRKSARKIVESHRELMSLYVVLSILPGNFINFVSYIFREIKTIYKLKRIDS